MEMRRRRSKGKGRRLETALRPDQFRKERGRLARVFQLDGFARTRRPRSLPDLPETAMAVGAFHKSLLESNWRPRLAEARISEHQYWLSPGQQLSSPDREITFLHR